MTRNSTVALLERESRKKMDRPVSKRGEIGDRRLAERLTKHFRAIHEETQAAITEAQEAIEAADAALKVSRSVLRNKI